VEIGKTHLVGTMPRIVVASLLGLAVVGMPIASAEQRHAAPTRPGTHNELALQVRLDRAHYSPGEIDGVGGSNTQKATAAFAKAHNIGLADVGKALEADSAPTTVRYTISEADVAGPFVEAIPTDMMEKAKLQQLSYTSAIEALGERFHTAPALLKNLNPGIEFVAGVEITVPNIADQTPAATGAIEVVVTKAASTLTAFDGTNQIIFFAPVTSGSEHDPLPIGDWKVTGVSRNPSFNYNPALFWDAEAAHAKAKIPPGPNSPVGVVWIDISKPHYGLHGTPEPGQIGHSESHGCVRLTNWDATTLAGLVKVGTRVRFIP